MNCPNCGKEMTLMRREITHDYDKKRVYERTVYFCLEDDIWVSVEVPKKDKENEQG